MTTRSCPHICAKAGPVEHIELDARQTIAKASHDGFQHRVVAEISRSSVFDEYAHYRCIFHHNMNPMIVLMPEASMIPSFNRTGSCGLGRILSRVSLSKNS